jgi:hypothetical protein
MAAYVLFIDKIMSIYNDKINQNELNKVIRDMQPDIKRAPNYNEVAANIVKQGIDQKHAFRAENNPFKPKSKLL